MSETGAQWARAAMRVQEAALRAAGKAEARPVEERAVAWQAAVQVAVRAAVQAEVRVAVQAAVQVVAAAAEVVFR